MPSARFPFADDVLFDHHTEVVFTRAWMNPRGVIDQVDTSYVVPPQTVKNPHLGFRSFFIPAMENVKIADDPAAQIPTYYAHKFQYASEQQLAEVNSIMTLTGEEKQDQSLANQAQAPIYQRGWLENNLAFLDSPGEWYLEDRPNHTLALYYMPEAAESDALIQSANFKIEIPVTFNLVALRGKPSRKATNNDAAVVEEPVQGVNFQGTTTWNPQPASADFTKLLVTNCFLKLRYSAWQYENGRVNDTDVHGNIISPALDNHEYYNFQHLANAMSGLIDGLSVDKLNISGCEIWMWRNPWWQSEVAGGHFRCAGLRPPTARACHQHGHQPQSHLRWRRHGCAD
jgi:hypothetical protein